MALHLMKVWRHCSFSFRINTTKVDRNIEALNLQRNGENYRCSVPSHEGQDESWSGPLVMSDSDTTWEARECDWSQDIVLDCAAKLGQRDTPLLSNSNYHAESGDGVAGLVDADATDVDAVEHGFHVGQRVNPHAACSHQTFGFRVGRVERGIAHPS